MYFTRLTKLTSFVDNSTINSIDLNSIQWHLVVGVWIGFVNTTVNEEGRVSSFGLHYNYRVNRSLDYAARKVAYTSHLRVGAYVRRYRGSRAGSRMTLHHGSLTGIVLSFFAHPVHRWPDVGARYVSLITSNQTRLVLTLCKSGFERTER